MNPNTQKRIVGEYICVDIRESRSTQNVAKVIRIGKLPVGENSLVTFVIGGNFTC